MENSGAGDLCIPSELLSRSELTHICTIHISACIEYMECLELSEFLISLVSSIEKKML